MVFGWGKKKEEKVQVMPIEERINLEDILMILGNIKKDKTSIIIDNTKNARKRIIDGYSELRSVVKDLQDDDLKTDEIDKSLQVIVFRGKDQVISVMNKEIPKDIHEINNQDDLEKVGKDLNQRLKVIGDVLGRQTRVIHIFAKKYAEKLKEILEEITVNTNDILQATSSLKNLDSKISETTNHYNEIKKIQLIKKEKTTRINELSNMLSEVERKINEQESKRNSLLKSKEFSEYQKVLDSIKEFEKTKAKINDEVNQQFTKISRALGRYSHGTLDKFQQGVYATLLSSPINALKKENKETLIIILDGVRKGVQSGSISVKDTLKSIAQINETIELLEGFIHKVSDFESKHSTLKLQLKVFNSIELDQIEETLEKLTDDKSNLESKIKLFKTEIDENDEKIPILHKEIEQSLNSISGKKYLLNYGL